LENIGGPIKLAWEKVLALRIGRENGFYGADSSMLALGLSESLLAVWDKPGMGGFVGLIEIDAAGGGLDTLTRFSLVTG
jgi:hypothetical protein